MKINKIEKEILGNSLKDSLNNDEKDISFENKSKINEQSVSNLEKEFIIEDLKKRILNNNSEISKIKEEISQIKINKNNNIDSSKKIFILENKIIFIKNVRIRKS